MDVIRKRRVSLYALLALFLLTTIARGQDTGKIPHEDNLRAAIAVQQSLTQTQQNLFSGALQNWLSFAHSLLDKPVNNPDDGAGLNGQSQSKARLSSSGTSLSAKHASSSEESEERNDVEQVSNPGLDLQASHLAGFTQSTTSTAWCGHNVVTGFNSTTASVQTILVPSFNGVGNVPGSSVDLAFSRDDGESFADVGFLNPGPFPNFIIGNPVLACADSRRFYFLTSPFATGTLASDGFTLTPLLGVAINISDDGGQHWGDPVAAFTKNSFHLIDKAWLALDPRNPNHLYVTYTDFDDEGFFPQFFSNPRCPGTSRSAIELVSSKDSGHTWTAPSIVTEACHPVDPVTEAQTGPSFTGSQVAVGKNGKVYISYLSVATDSDINSFQLKFRSSDNHGKTFGAEINVTDIVQTGCCAFVDGIVGQFQGFLQGFFQTIDFPSMAVDSRGERDMIYLVWADGRDNSTIDVVVANNGTYNFGDILMSKSTNGGGTWTTPRAISPTPEDFAGAGRDQFQPGIAINEDGKIAVCYNDRRNDPANNLVDHYCSFSENHGESFHDVRQTTSSWIPVHFSESTVVTAPAYLGDYDGVAAHQGTKDGDQFFSGFQVIKNVIPSAHGRSSNREQ